jgi:hypothetical protein
VARAFGAISGMISRRCGCTALVCSTDYLGVDHQQSNIWSFDEKPLSATASHLWLQGFLLVTILRCHERPVLHTTYTPPSAAEVGGCLLGPED